ncbi:MAG: four helix bundle protein [Bacteroidetes bacterium]|nr:four helix bundle protein [Bacteroidota bacterium]
MKLRKIKSTLTLSKSEDYGLTSQLRRSANSISANVAAAFGRNTPKNKNRLYTIARGSAFENQSNLLYGQKINYFEKNVNNLLKSYN